MSTKKAVKLEQWWVVLPLVLIGLIRFQLAAYPKCTLVQDFGRLLESNQFTDINFLVGFEPGVVVTAHIALVAARSDWLRSRMIRALTPCSNDD